MLHKRKPNPQINMLYHLTIFYSSIFINNREALLVSINIDTLLKFILLYKYIRLIDKLLIHKDNC